MHLISKLLISIALISSFSISEAKEIELRPEMFGAKTNDDKDDSFAFIQIAQTIKNGQFHKVTIILSKGVYDLNQRVNITGLTSNLEILGTPETLIRIRGQLGMFISARATDFTVKRKIANGQHEVIINEKPDNLSPGDIIHLQSDSKFETGWNYKENDIHRIEKVEGDRVLLKEPVIFNYEPGEEKVKTTVYKKIRLVLKNLSFELNPLKDSLRTEAMIMRGLELSAENIKVSYSNKRLYFHNGFSISACVDMDFKNIQLENLMYGVLMNFCRNITAKNTRAFYTRHAYVPATATINFYANNLYGYKCHSVMDAHVAFNVTYENVLDTLATQYPDCRALGVQIKNTRLYTGNNNYQLYCYWSVQTLVPEYTFLYSLADQLFENVIWIGNAPGRLNGISSYTCRTLTVRNCKTHSVSYYGGQKILKNIEITDSEIGLIYLMSQKASIRNVVMNGKLFPNAPFVFRLGGTGPVEIIDSRITGYNSDSTYLFEVFHNQPRNNSLLIKNTSIQKLRAWTNKLIDPRVRYSTLKIENSKIEGFREDLPQEIKLEN